MRLIVATLSSALLCGTAAAAQPSRVDDPAAFSETIVRDFTAHVPDMARSIAAAIGRPETAEGLTRSLQQFAGKRIDFADKVVDQKYGTALNQIVYYTFIDDFGFLYLRFNFKRTTTGWILSNFTYRSETDELFPAGFGPRQP